MITENVFLFGCPHCGDGVPALVTLMTHAPYEPRITFVNVEDEVKEALLKYGSTSIIACKKLVQNQ